MDDVRREFETWISSPPFRKSIAKMHSDSSWPGVYVAIDVHLAWEAWREAYRRGDRCSSGCVVKKAVGEFNGSVTDDF